MTSMEETHPVIQPKMKGTAATPRSKRPLSRHLQAQFGGAINVPMRAVLGLPFSTPLRGRLMLVSPTSSRAGKAYRQPPSYGRQCDTRLTPGGAKWKLNLRAGEPVAIRLRGRDVCARPELVSDLDEIERLLAVMTAANPSVSAFVGVPKGPDRGLDKARLQIAVQYGFRIVRWHLDQAQAIGPRKGDVISDFPNPGAQCHGPRSTRFEADPKTTKALVERTRRPSSVLERSQIHSSLAEICGGAG